VDPAGRRPGGGHLLHARRRPQILAGDSWVGGLSELDENGEMDTGVVLFVCSFRLLVEWILLQAPIPRPSQPLGCPPLARALCAHVI
jgi:hypothetical protein